MIELTGQTGKEVKLVSQFSQNDFDFAVGINQSFTLFNSISFKYNQYVSFNACSEINISNIPRRRKIFKTFGMGINFNYNSTQSLMEVEEDISDYEYDKL